MSASRPSTRQGRWLRMTAVVVLLLGISGAELAYWRGTRSADSPNLLPAVGEDKAVTHRADMIMGQQAVLADEWGRDLQRPGTQAALIIVISVLVAGGCFYIARLLDQAEQRSGGVSRPDSNPLSK